MSTANNTSLIHELADFVYSLRIETIPEAVLRQATLCILDTVGCMIAGCNTEEAKKILTAEEISNGTGECVIVGEKIKLPPYSAARVNGYMGDIFEINDLIGGHASIANVSAALALSEKMNASGQQLLMAVVAGIEVTAKLYNAFYPHLKSYEECGITSVGVPSTVGAAAVSSRLFGLSNEETKQALAIGAALSGWCPAEVIFGSGGTVKPMLFGSLPGSVGMQAANYARAGVSGPPNILESRIGYFTTAANGYDRQAISSQSWALEQPRRKMHACCGYIHSALDAVIRIRQTQPQCYIDAEELRVELPPYVMPAVAKDDALPRSANEARFNAKYCIALAATGIDVIAPENSQNFAGHLASEPLAKMLRKIRISSNPELSHYHHAIIIVQRHDGSVHAERNLAPKGAPSNPMSDEEVITKYNSLSSPMFGPSVADEIRQRIACLNETTSLRRLFDLLSGSGEIFQ